MKRDISKKSTHISKKEYLFFFRAWFPLIYGSFAQLFLMKSIKLRNYDKILSNLSHFKKASPYPAIRFLSCFIAYMLSINFAVQREFLLLIYIISFIYYNHRSPQNRQQHHIHRRKKEHIFSGHGPIRRGVQLVGDQTCH